MPERDLYFSFFMFTADLRPGDKAAALTTARHVEKLLELGYTGFDVPIAPTVDPTTVVLADPVVAEDKRFCSKCGAAVGRSKGDRRGRESGFCGSCRHAYDFQPKLAPGHMLGGQYEVIGCLAHGGLGWIYLGRDRAVNDRWIVLKGLLDAGVLTPAEFDAAKQKLLAQ